MELTRRDATAALAAIGATGGAALGARRIRCDHDPAPRPEEGISDEQITKTMIAIADVVYPDAVSGIDGFVGGFLDGRLDDRSHATAIRETVSELDERAREWHDGSIAELPAETRDRLLREVGADSAEEDPTGTLAERARYYVVNELLLALYASPRGGELVGIENPQGHPGGTESYRRGP